MTDRLLEAQLAFPRFDPKPKRPYTPWPMAPNQTAIWPIVQAALARLWPAPDAELFEAWRWDVEPLADVRRELDAFINQHNPNDVTLQGIRALNEGTTTL